MWVVGWILELGITNYVLYKKSESIQKKILKKKIAENTILTDNVTLNREMKKSIASCISINCNASASRNISGNSILKVSMIDISKLGNYLSPAGWNLQESHWASSETKNSSKLVC